ncbi:reverse transcriptase-like protein [Candidatus Saccharibacteria bacterium TM7i]|nr:reverse transcriptase-like protein [Candidatus Saccharibacteria bacterium TM7i]
MKQKLSVRAIISEESKTLLLKRSNGRESILGKYELPGGKLSYGEQPEDALRRYLHDDAGIHIQSAQLFDAVTYIDHDDRDIQYGVLVYNVTLSPQRHPMQLSGNYNKYKWYSGTNLQQNELTDLTQLLLGIIQQEEITDKALAKSDKNADKKTTESNIILYSDGGSRGNPGPSAAGFVIMDGDGVQLASGGEYLGVATNNVAEYHGLLLGLEKALELGYRTLECRLDSMLVVNQMKGIYKIKNRELWPVHERIRLLTEQFDRVRFAHVTRNYNQLADGVVNKVLDQHIKEMKAVGEQVLTTL